MNIVDNWEWSSHQPLIRGALAEFKPNYILELGMGEYSTPIFIEYSPEEMLGVENEKEWLEHVNKKYGTKYPSILHQLDSKLGLGTFLRELTDEQKETIKDYYKDLSIDIKNNNNSPKLLFVDQFTCCRTLSINTLYDYFDVIIYHDCQPPGIDWYEYYFDKELKDTYTHYTLKTPIVWTGCFVKNSLKDNNLHQTILPYIKQYCAEHKLNESEVFLANE